jgi:hypothetical protein
MTGGGVTGGTSTGGRAADTSAARTGRGTNPVGTASQGTAGGAAGEKTTSGGPDKERKFIFSAAEAGEKTARRKARELEEQGE